MRRHVAASCTGASAPLQERIVLILEELFCNTVEHGYQGESDRPVWVAFRPEPGGCWMTYEDSAEEHDPFVASQDPLLDAGVELRPIGGLGLFLVEELSSSHAYERRDGRNVITVHVRENTGEPGAAAPPGVQPSDEGN
jgi:anti-sigma regulatory factor (Ser/Thr protein kinase)